MGVRRIVVGVDGSEQAANALLWTIEVAHGVDADVTAVFALAPPFPVGCLEPGCKLPAYACELDPNWRRQLRREFEEDWCRLLRQSGLRYRMVFADGKAATVIADVAVREDADLVVAGDRGRGRAVDPMPGSVGHELCQHCPKPVVLVGAGGSRRLTWGAWPTCVTLPVRARRPWSGRHIGPMLEAEVLT